MLVNTLFYMLKLTRVFVYKNKLFNKVKYILSTIYSKRLQNINPN